MSELFGHEKGAFTGATSRKRGRFERADGGTLFLDEIGDISPATQVALLRVLEEKSFERVGGSTSIQVDVRIVCATNRDLRHMVDEGSFREDLYYRLSGISLAVPSLRSRLMDLPELCRALLKRIAKTRGEAPKTLSEEAVELLTRYRWPGNVRELENALRAASLFAPGQEIQSQDFLENVESLQRSARESVEPSSPGEALPAPSSSATEVSASAAAYREVRGGAFSLAELKKTIERECITQALAETGGNITRAAAVLGMKRPRLSQLVKQYDLLNSSEKTS